MVAVAVISAELLFSVSYSCYLKGSQDHATHDLKGVLEVKAATLAVDKVDALGGSLGKGNSLAESESSKLHARESVLRDDQRRRSRCRGSCDSGNSCGGGTHGKGGKGDKSRREHLESWSKTDGLGVDGCCFGLLGSLDILR